MSGSNSNPYRVLLFYRYVRLDDPENYAAEHRELCERLELRGRILIGPEGINGTVSGNAERTDAYMAALHADSRMADMEFKIDACDGHVFRKLSVKARPEIVTLGLDGTDDIDPNVITGERLTPAEFAVAMETEDTVLLDGRNDYESELGHFKNAICPDVEHFRDFPDWLRDHAEVLRGKRILTYCTGGIRCEKLSGYLLREGFENVAQLNGGIINYSQDPETRGRDFDGLCYVFDERVGVEVNHTETHTVVSKCRHCGEPSPRYRNCAFPDCNAQIFICENCEAGFGKFCGELCRDAVSAG